MSFQENIQDEQEKDVCFMAMDVEENKELPKRKRREPERNDVLDKELAQETSRFKRLEGPEISCEVDDLVRPNVMSVRHRKLETNYSIAEEYYELLEHVIDQAMLFEENKSVSHAKLSEKLKNRNCDAVWEIDIPERMQIFEETTGHPPTDEICIKMEAEWIYNELVDRMVPFFNNSATTEAADDELKRHIARFLELMHVQKLDVPFIAMYRKEDISSLLKDPIRSEVDIENYPNQKPKLKWHEVLWTIQDLDQKWLLLQKRKSSLQSCYTERFQKKYRGIYDETRLMLKDQIFESITESLKAADSEREVDDVDLKFNFHFPLGKATQDERPLSEVHHSEQFDSQISLKKIPMDELGDSEEMASNISCAAFETPEDVLKGVRHMAAIEFSLEPCVRKHVRRIFMENAVVSTSPTPNGNRIIDNFHRFFGVKWLREKPLRKFEDGQWLLIQKADEEKLLQVTINLPQVVLDKLISASNDYYPSDGVGKSAQLWNKDRKLILRDAFHNFLLPSMEKESISLLTSRAKSWVCREYGKLLWDKVSWSPVDWKKYQNDDMVVDKTTAPRVMACCWGPGNPATTFVMLDSFGEVIDVLQAGSLRQFMMNHDPQAVVLGAANLACRQLAAEIKEGISNMVEDSPRIVDFFYVDESLPRLYENSCISVDQLPSREGIIRRAVALGRYYQNPLAMVASLCGPSGEILSWELTSFDAFLTPGEKYRMVEQVMVDLTNQVGLDICLGSRHEWLSAPLQFISGLGPRKAAALRSSLQMVGSFNHREELRTRHGIGDKVFNNAVGFLPVREHVLISSTNLLDYTRIHPESYIIAQDLAKYIYEMDFEVNSFGYDDSLTRYAVEYVRQKPQLLKDVDVYEYAQKKKLLDKKETLNDIIVELGEGYKDWRSPYELLSLDDLFYMLSGESVESLCEEKIVEAKVRKVCPRRVFCVLESGLSGVLNSSGLSISEGDILTCRIKSVLKHYYAVVLSLEDGFQFQKPRIMDTYYHEEWSSSMC